MKEDREMYLDAAKSVNKEKVEYKPTPTITKSHPGTRKRTAGDQKKTGTGNR